MKLAYAIVTALLLAPFVAGYVFWFAEEKREAVAERERAVARANQTKKDFYSGKAFVGRDGRKEAESDISRGAAKFFLYGKTRGHIAELTMILKQRFGVELDPLAGCIVSEPLVLFATDYNAAIRSHIAAKFGAGALEEADREALRIWESKRKTDANQPPQHNAGSRPLSGDSSASETPSSLSPRG